MITIKTLRLAQTLFSKVSIELIIDEYEVIAVDCIENKERIASCHDPEGLECLYKALMEIYSVRIDDVKKKSEQAKKSEAPKINSLLDWTDKKEQEEG